MYEIDLSREIYRLGEMAANTGIYGRGDGNGARWH
jgi:hypothetical protein